MSVLHLNDPEKLGERERERKEVAFFMNKITILLAIRKGRLDVGLHNKHTDLNKVVFYC